MAVQNKHVPKDAQVIQAILKDMGVTDYEPRVVNQLMEFTYRYVSCILDDAKIYANHAKKKQIDLDDVRLAVQMQLDRCFTTPPPRDMLLEVARSKNNSPLPFIKPHYGLRLPPDRYCLSACNYRLRSNKKPQPKVQISGSQFSLSSNPRISIGSQGMGLVTNPKLQPISAKPGTTLSIVPGAQNSQGLAIYTKQATIPPVQRPKVTAPKPVIKFSAATTQATAMPKIQVSAPGITAISAVQNPSLTSTVPVKMEVDETGTTGVKRKREDDDFEMPE